MKTLETKQMKKQMKKQVKKQIKKIGAGALVLNMLLMSGCGQGELPQDNTQEVGNKNVAPENVAMGRYVEKTLALPDMGKGFLMGMGQTQQGIEAYIYQDEIKVYRLTSDDTWEEQDAPWSTAYQQLGEGWYQDKLYTNGEETYIAYCLAEESKTRIYKLGKDNKLEDLNIDWEYEQDYVTPETLEVLPDGDLIVSDAYMGVHRYKATDGTFVRAYGESSPSVAVIGDKMYQIAVQDSSVKSYDLESGKLIETIPCEGVDDSSKLIPDNQGGLYLLNNQGINHLVQGGSIWERVMDTDRYSFSMPSLECLELIVKDDVFFAVFRGAEGEYQFKKYVYAQDTPSKPQNEVFVYMLEEQPTLKQAIAQYQIDNPEVQVSFQIGLEEGSTLTKTDAMRALNTEILAGKGPDLLVLDGLPVETYMEKGVLEDMSDWAKPFMDQGLWLSSVAASYEKEDKLYAVPIRFAFPTLWGDEAVLQSGSDLEELAKWCKLHPNEKLFPDYSEEQLLRAFYLTTATTWKDAKGTINEEAFATFLENIKRVQQPELMKEKEIGTNGHDPRTEQIAGLLDVAYGETAVHILTPKASFDLLMAVAANEKRGQSGFVRLGNQEEGVFIPQGIVGINVNSDNKDIVQEIIETALSDTIQRINLGDGFAVNNKALQESFAHNEEDTSSFGVADHKGRELFIDGNYSWAQEAFLQLCQESKVPVMMDETLMEIIVKETKGYFKGEMTAQEAARAVAKRAQAYLVE
ncbi:MAG: ABC transporter substrate-binding protein [Niameybacter sp.]